MVAKAMKLTKEDQEILDLAKAIHRLDCTFSQDEGFTWETANTEFYTTIAAEMLTRFSSSKGVCKLTILHLIDLVDATWRSPATDPT